MRSRELLPSFLLVAFALSASAPVGAQEGPRLLAEEASGIVPVTGETRLIVEGIAGVIAVDVREPGGLAFSSEMGSEKGQPFPVALWLDGGTFRLAPVAGAPEMPRRLQVHVPPGMSLRVSATGSRVGAEGITGSLEISGKDLSVAVGNLQGDATLEVEGGAVTVGGTSASVTVRGRGTAVTLGACAGPAYVSLTGGSVNVSSAVGTLELDLDSADLAVTGSQSSVRLRARGGKAELAGLEKGGDLSLAGTTLGLRDSRGNLTVETDSAVQLGEAELTLRVTLAGGSVRGKGNRGALEIHGDGGGTVDLESIVGAVKVEGSGLKVHLKDLSGEVAATASSSEISVEKATGPVKIEDDQGDVTLTQILREVQVRSKGGDVLLGDLNGAVDVEADGRSVEVSWLSIPHDKDSSIKNEGGTVTVRFPASAACRVEAEAKYGRVESDLPKVVVLDGGASAQGTVGYASRPVVRVVASGDVRLVGGASPDEEQP